MTLKIIIFAFLVALCTPRLAYVANVLRHGARYPVRGDIYDGNETKQFHGRLTTVGMRQQLLLGSYLKADYIDKQKLINSTIYMKEIQVFSDSTERCQQSALSHLLGMFPYGTGQRLPQGIDQSMLKPPFESFLNQKQNLQKQEKLSLGEFALNLGFSPVSYKNGSQYFIKCPNEAKIIQARLKKQAVKIAQFQATHAAFTQKMRLVFNLSAQFANIAGLAELFDIVTCDMFLGRSLPSNFNDYDYNQLTFIHDYLFAVLYGGQSGKVFSTPFMSAVLGNMDNVAKKGKEEVKKYSIYSGHDTTIMPMLMFLNLTTPECMSRKWKNETVKENCAQAPPFASNLIFQLHADDSEQQYSVKVRYNGVYYKLCETDQYQCSYEEFAQRVRAQIVDVKKQCGITGFQQQHISQKNLETKDLFVAI